MKKDTLPEIMAPAGDTGSYLAAVAAGADAIYVGLKHFSARMQAQNFSISELGALASLGRNHDVRTYVAMNTLVKPDDPDAAARLIDRLNRQVRPAALIVQDLGMLALARQAGFKGELHLSTLANVSHPAGLKIAKSMGADRVVVPRELNLDEVKLMAEARPQGLDLELFVHGALCHCVSGRCYWSSFLGGKSGLRGRCVQPCRRLYRRTVKGGRKAKPERLFSCTDLSLDVLTKPLLDVEGLSAWKIEGRKKGPHYVYYTVKAYRLLRDEPTDPEAKKMAVDFLDQALGRPATHALFLPQRPFSPVRPADETSSGRQVGVIKRDQGKLYFKPREELLPGDLIRVGYEDQPGHRTISLRKRIPKGGRMDIPMPKGKRPPKGAPKPGPKGKPFGGPGPVLPSGTLVFLVDRREPELVKEIKTLEKELAGITPSKPQESKFQPVYPKPFKPFRARPKEITLERLPSPGRNRTLPAFWLERTVLSKIARGFTTKVQWWLPPVIWPGEEQKYRSLVKAVLDRGARELVLNAPWQMGLLPPRHKASLIAGPFCNAANRFALDELRKLGFASAIISPELPGEDVLALAKNSPLPLGMVIKGLWPLGVARFSADEVKPEEPLASPMNEVAWVRKYGETNWIFPGWELDLTSEQKLLEQTGYKMFVTMVEPWPRNVPRARRTSTFNWKLQLL